VAQYALGLDYGTNSVRALLVDLSDGSELAGAVSNYRSGDAGIIEDPNNPNLARQNPADYQEGFYEAVRSVLHGSGVDPAEIVGIGVDTTGSTPMPVDQYAKPLALHDHFKSTPAAHAWLWKDHTSYREAAEITETAKATEQPYLAKCGGVYSSEWFWSKILCCARQSPEVFEAAYSWVEIADWIPAWLTGKDSSASIVRGICAAGHKAMFADEWGGLPSPDFLATLAPELPGLRERLYSRAYTGDHLAGHLSEEVAAGSGLKVGTPVAVGAFDAHFGAVGAGIKTGTLVKIMGTSTCDCMVHPEDQPLADIPGLCGIVKGSVLPGYYGLEAGQSAVGDIFNWFVELSGRGHEELTSEAMRRPAGASGLLALDWHNGNRTVLVDPLLTGAVLGQTLHTTSAEVYRALVEATAFGALKIVNRLEEYGVMVKEVINCGGIAEKNPFVMQIYADAMNRPMKVSRSAQTCALGSAIFGAVAAGAFRSVEEAQQAMTGTKEVVYEPEPLAAATYARLFTLYSQVHDAMAIPGSQSSLGNVMKDLIEIRAETRG
jgi:L-ribulokinase